MDEPLQNQKAKRSGSETRRATARVTFRMTPEQRHQLNEWANDAGVEPASYARAKVFSGQQLRAKPKPQIERQGLAQLLALIGRLGGNVNQIARTLNFGEQHDPKELDRALKEITEMRNALMSALGREA